MRVSGVIPCPLSITVIRPLSMSTNVSIDVAFASMPIINNFLKREYNSGVIRGIHPRIWVRRQQQSIDSHQSHSTPQSSYSPFSPFTLLNVHPLLSSLVEIDVEFLLRECEFVITAFKSAKRSRTDSIPDSPTKRAKPIPQFATHLRKHISIP